MDNLSFEGLSDMSRSDRAIIYTLKLLGDKSLSRIGTDGEFKFFMKCAKGIKDFLEDKYLL